jgi:hypothetical protein
MGAMSRNVKKKDFRMSDDDIANADGIKQGDTESQTMEF